MTNVQQTLTSITSEAILYLEGKGWRFRASDRNGRQRLIIKRGEVDSEAKSTLRYIKVSEACEYLTERAQGYIRECRQVMNGRGD
jgi:hypothetical protein